MTRKPWLTAAALAVLAATAAQAHDANRPSVLAVSGRIIDGSGAAPILGGRVVAVDGVITCVGRAADCPTPPSSTPATAASSPA
ncbi:hypothetical protein [Brevundimonas diminuta]